MLRIPLCWAAACFALGILADATLAIAMPIWWMMLLGFLGAFLIARKYRLSTVAAILIVAVWVSLGGWWHHYRWNCFPPSDISHFAKDTPQPVCVIVEVTRTPKAIELVNETPSTRAQPELVSYFPAVARKIRLGQQWKPVSGRVRVKVQGKLHVRRGDWVQIFGQIRLPTRASNPGEFDRRAYYRSNRCLAWIQTRFPEAVTIVRHGPVWTLPALLDRIRVHADHILATHIQPEALPLARAVLLGIRDDIMHDLHETFVTTGAVHLLAISGLHLGILAYFVIQLLRRLIADERRVCFLTMLIVISYVLLIESRESSVRAAVFVCMFCMSQILARPFLPSNALAAAALFCLVANPHCLFHAGAQLSFLGCAVLVFLGQKSRLLNPSTDALEKLTQSTHPLPLRILRWALRLIAKSYFVSFVLWWAMLPVVLHHFHVLAWVAPLVGPIALPPIALAIVGGFFTLATGAIFPLLGKLFGVLTGQSLLVLRSFLSLVAQVPGNPVWLPAPYPLLVWCFYTLLGATALCWQRLTAKKTLIACLAVNTMAVIASCYHRPQVTSLRATAFSVGHGCCVLVELPGGETLLYDAGRFGDPYYAARAVAESLWHYRIRKLNLVVLSHPDVDHFNMLPFLVDWFSVERIATTRFFLEKRSPSVQSLLNTVAGKGIPVEEIAGRDRLIDRHDCVVEVLHPPPNWQAPNDNEASLVLSVRTPGGHVLLTGDIGSVAFEELKTVAIAPCDFLVAPHHGSSRSTRGGFCEWARPRVVVFSGGRQDLFPTAQAAYEEWGAKVFHTAVQGAVTATAGKSWQFRAFVEDR